MSDKEWYDGRIKEVASKIRKELVNGWLYGYPIDLTNEDEVLVAAHFAAMLKKDMVRVEDRKILGESE